MFRAWFVTASLIVMASGFGSRAVAQDSPATVGPSVGQRQVLIVWGLSGDADHHKAFAQTVNTLVTGLANRCGVSTESIQLLTGDEPQVDDSEMIRASQRATKEAVTEAVKSLRERAGTDDGVWVFVLGHTHYDGKVSWLNLPGPDMHHSEFAKLFEGMTAREQVFVLTTSTSGSWIKALSAKNRVILSATDAAGETNETDFPHELARLMAASDLTTADLDADRDGQFSLFDLYITTVRNIAQAYFDGQMLATEHGLLDDDGDGRGTELQIDYLVVDLGGRLQPNRPFQPPVMTKGDGVLAKTITLHSLATVADPPPVDALDVYPPRDE